MKRSIRLALFAAAALFTQVAAHAGEITLFTDANFGGRELVVRDWAPDLGEMGFNDRASSMVVRSGRWEVCADADFHGQCVVFERGEYPTLERFNDKISSVREIGGAPPDRARWDREHGGPRGMIELYSRPGLSGNSTRLLRDMDNFERIGFNDRTVSVAIEAGRWELCSDSDFNGVCRVFGPGRYADLGPGLAGRVSSARLVGDDRPRGGDDRPHGPPPMMQSSVELFEGDAMRGRAIELRDFTPDFNQVGFNDKAGSLVVHGGAWEFCTDSGFHGRCVILQPGEYRNLDRSLWHAISSARPVRR